MFQRLYRYVQLLLVYKLIHAIVICMLVCFSIATVEVQAKALLGKYFEKFGKVSSDSDLRRLETFLSHHAS